MTAISCARCGQDIRVPARGPRPTYCGDACRKAAGRAAPAPVPAVSEPTLVRSFAHGPSYGRGLGDGDDCPQDRAHGAMYFVDPAKTRQWCPSSQHEGNAFYARDGVTPALRSPADFVAAALAGGPAETTGVQSAAT